MGADLDDGLSGTPMDAQVFDGSLSGFTPNGDGRNDTWRILTGKPVVPSVRLNRWGGLVLESTAFDNNWAAHDLAAGVYYYTVDVPGCKTSFKGNVQVIR